MKTFSTLKSLATNLSNNVSTANDTLMGQLISDEHRYLLQRWFDNERTYTTSTIGAQDITFTGALLAGATSGTLTSAWTGPTVTQYVSFSGGDQLQCLFSNGSAAVTWQTPLQAAADAAASTVGVQAYPIPPNVSKIIDDTVNVGQLKYRPAPIMTRAEWDMVNFLPYTSDIPNYYFIYNGAVEIFPIPSTTGNVITFNYKTRVADLSFADYSTGTVGVTAGDPTVTGVGTDWSGAGAFPTGVDIGYFNLALRIAPPKGDGIWYPIKRFASGTSLELYSPVLNAPNAASGASYTIGQLPLLQEDFQDLIVFRALRTYFSSIVKDKDRYAQFDALCQERERLLEAYAGTKQVNVDLGAQPYPVNPNLFIYAQ